MKIIEKLRKTMCYRLAGYSGYLLPIVFMCLYLFISTANLCDGFGAFVCMGIGILYCTSFFVFFIGINLSMLFELYLMSKNITANTVKTKTILGYIIFTAVVNYYLYSRKSFDLIVFMAEWVSVGVVFAVLLLLDKIIGARKIRKLVDVGYILLIVFCVFIWVVYSWPI